MQRRIETPLTDIRYVRKVRPSSGPLPIGSLATLEQRLHDGYARIEQAKGRGEDVTAWEEFWIELLHQYEATFDDLPEAA